MKENYTNYDNLIKIVIIGDSGVGKSNYLYRFVEGEFCPIHEATVGFDYKSKVSYLPKAKKKVKFQIWDTAGQEKYMSINKNLFQRVQGIILMYDISFEKSFTNLDKWMTVIKQLADGIPLILIGNKIDLENLRKVSKERGEQFANDNNIDFFESSGKSGENVEESFIFLGEQIFRLNKNKNNNDTNEYVISKETTNKKTKKCC
jgi:small GTP-binding protein